MSSGRDFYFTLADEAAFSELLLKKYPSAVFAANEHPSETDFRVFPSIESADCWLLRVFVPPPKWRPILKPGGIHGLFKIANPPELELHLIRSSHGWTQDNLTAEGGPRWITDGGCGVIYYPSPNRAQRSFRDRVWRIFPKIATWELEAYDSQTRRKVAWEKTDKIVWAGNDAIRWARENPLRRFTGKGVIYGPKKDG
jgi:hypothetical protein